MVGPRIPEDPCLTFELKIYAEVPKLETDTCHQAGNRLHSDRVGGGSNRQARKVERAEKQ